MEQDKRREPVRVLHIVGSMHPGGTQHFIMNLYESIDRTRVQFDVILHEQTEGDYCDRIRELGGKVYKLPRMTGKPIENLRGIRKIVREGKYNIVIRHTPNAVVAPQLWAAKRGGAKCVILHSHATDDPAKTLHRIGRFVSRHMKIQRFACSEAAGQWMFGRNRPFTIVKNAIDTQHFAFSPEKRVAIREELGIRDCKLYGHVGNFVPVKNHTFLMRVFAELAREDSAARFICVGDGELRVEIEEDAKMLGIKDKVFFAGIRHDTDAIMSSMDVLIFPSIHEGIPLTLIEAQAAGLPILMSEAVSKDVEVTENLVHRRNIAEEPAVWASEARILAGMTTTRECQRERIVAAGYDISELVKWYEDYFINA